MKRIALITTVLGLMLSGCASTGSQTPSALPTVVLGEGSQQAAPVVDPSSGNRINANGITASGYVVPAQQAQLSFSTGEKVAEINVQIGDQVEAGQVLVRLSGSPKWSAAVDAANLELLASQTELDRLKDGHAEALAAAQLRLAQAKIDLEDAEKDRQSKNYQRASQGTINGLRADYIMAEQALKDAQDFYNGLGALADDDPVRAQGLSNLSKAQNARDRALSNLNYAMGLPNENEIEKAEAQLNIARTEFDSAQNEVDRLAKGPDPAELALVEARIQNAQSQLAASQGALADLELTAPFRGTISKIDIFLGEWATPGQPVIELADLAHLQIETNDLSERDVPGIKIGQPVTVLIKALNQDVSGKVSQISPLAEILGGDVVYRTVIQLDDIPPELRAGMSVDVQFTIER